MSPRSSYRPKLPSTHVTRDMLQKSIDTSSIHSFLRYPTSLYARVYVHVIARKTPIMSRHLHAFTVKALKYIHFHTNHLERLPLVCIYFAGSLPQKTKVGGAVNTDSLCYSAKCRCPRSVDQRQPSGCRCYYHAGFCFLFSSTTTGLSAIYSGLCPQPTQYQTS